MPRKPLIIDSGGRMSELPEDERLTAGWYVRRKRIAEGETLSIQNEEQLIVFNELIIDGELVVEDGGEAAIL